MSRNAARVVGLVVVVALGVGLVVTRCVDRGDRSFESVEAATLALRAGLGGDAAGFGVARERFAAAAAGVVFEPYPLFALEVVEVLVAARDDKAALLRVAEGARPVFQAWLEGRFEDALVLAAKLPASGGGGHLARLAQDLVRVDGR